MVWKQYLKTAPYIQGAIAIVAIALFLSQRFLPMQIAIVVLTMEIGAVIGAFWGVRLKRRLGGDPTMLSR